MISSQHYKEQYPILENSSFIGLGNHLHHASMNLEAGGTVGNWKGVKMKSFQILYTDIFFLLARQSNEKASGKPPASSTFS